MSKLINCLKINLSIIFLLIATEGCNGQTEIYDILTSKFTSNPTEYTGKVIYPKSKEIDCQELLKMGLLEILISDDEVILVTINPLMHTTIVDKFLLYLQSTSDSLQLNDYEVVKEGFPDLTVISGKGSEIQYEDYEGELIGARISLGYESEFFDQFSIEAFLKKSNITFSDFDAKAYTFIHYSTISSETFSDEFKLCTSESVSPLNDNVYAYSYKWEGKNWELEITYLR